MNFEIRHFLLLDTIDRLGTMTEASAHLLLTQSALSHQVRDLEEKTGFPVFDRVGRNIRLNARGKLIRNTGIDIFSQLRALEDRLQAEKHPRKTLKIKLECYTTYRWLPKVLRAYHNRFPGVDLQLDSTSTLSALQAVERGEIDVAIFSEVKPSRKLIVRPFFKDEVKILVSKHHRYATRRDFDPEQVKAESLIVHRPLEETVFFQEVLKPRKLKPQKVTYIPLTEAAVELVKANFGIMPISEWAVQTEVQRGEVVPLSVQKQGLFRNWFIAYRKEADAALLGFVEELMKQPFSGK